MVSQFEKLSAFVILSWSKDVEGGLNKLANTGLDRLSLTRR